MSEHAILFSGEMVRAILEGRKTQTRRVIKDVPEHITHIEYIPSDFDEPFEFLFTRDDHISGFWDKCPYGRIGDRLWVKETWRMLPGAENISMPFNSVFSYAADWSEKEAKVIGPWKSSRFMPREASRITLEIVRVRVERVQEITGSDCYWEGVGSPYTGGGAKTWQEGQRKLYQDLWNKINAKRGFGWDVNPWVWVIEFKKVV